MIVVGKLYVREFVVQCKKNILRRIKTYSDCNKGLCVVSPKAHIKENRNHEVGKDLF